MLNRRTFLYTSTFATLAMLSGCGTSPDKLEISFLQGSIPPQLVGDFKKAIAKIGQIKLLPEVTLQEIYDLLIAWQESTPEKTSLIDSLPLVGKGKSSQAGLVTLGDYWLQKAIAENLLQPLDLSSLSAWDSLSSQWQNLVTRDQKGNLDPRGKVYGAPYRWGNTVIAYRKDKIDWIPTDWADLWREEVRDRISLPDDPREVIGLTLKKLGHSYNTEDLTQISDLKAELQQLHQQVKFYSSDQYLQPLALGDTWLGVGWSTDVLAIANRYADIGVVVPAAGTSLWADVWVQPRIAEEETAITSLMNNWLDFCWQAKPAKQILLFTNAVSPIFTTGENPDLAEDLAKNPVLKATLTNFNRSEFLHPLATETETQYRDLWQQIRQ